MDLLGETKRLRKIVDVTCVPEPQEISHQRQAFLDGRIFVLKKIQMQELGSQCQRGKRYSQRDADPGRRGSHVCKCGWRSQAVSSDTTQPVGRQVSHYLVELDGTHAQIDEAIH